MLLYLQHIGCSLVTWLSPGHGSRSRLFVGCPAKNHHLDGISKSACFFHSNPEKKKAEGRVGGASRGQTASNKTNCIMWLHQKQQVFLLLFVHRRLRQKVWPTARLSELSCSLMSNEATGLATWATNSAPSQSAESSEKSQQVDCWFAESLHIVQWWKQRFCCPGHPTCCLVALQVELNVRLNPSVLPPGWHPEPNRERLTELSGLNQKNVWQDKLKPAEINTRALIKKFRLAPINIKNLVMLPGSPVLETCPAQSPKLRFHIRGEK